MLVFSSFLTDHGTSTVNIEIVHYPPCLVISIKYWVVTPDEQSSECMPRGLRVAGGSGGGASSILLNIQY